MHRCQEHGDCFPVVLRILGGPANRTEMVCHRWTLKSRSRTTHGYVRETSGHLMELTRPCSTDSMIEAGFQIATFLRWLTGNATTDPSHRASLLSSEVFFLP